MVRKIDIIASSYLYSGNFRFVFGVSLCNMVPYLGRRGKEFTNVILIVVKVLVGLKMTTKLDVGFEIERFIEMGFNINVVGGRRTAIENNLRKEIGRASCRERA